VLFVKRYQFFFVEYGVGRIKICRIKETTEAELDKLADEKDLKRGKLIHLTRLAVSGMSVGPGLFVLLELVGQKRVVARLRRAVDFINSNM